MRTVNGRRVLLQAHRGVSTRYPENTMAAFQAACCEGYDLIELDPKFTRDDQCVVLHDGTVNRTGRTPSGDAPARPLPITELTLEEARAFEYGSWMDARFAGEPLPLLKDVLALLRKRRMPVKLDNVMESFSPERLDILFQLVEQSGLGELAGFTGAHVEFLERVAERFPQCTLHYDGPVTEEALSRLAPLAKKQPMVVWAPYPNRLTSWCHMPPLDKALAASAHAIGARVGAWILESEDELIGVLNTCPVDIVETTGALTCDPN